MNIYSIKEIVDATNNLLKPNKKTKLNKTTKLENSSQPLILKSEALLKPKDQSDSLNLKIKIKTEIKDKIINELYIFLKKKLKKNTLKLIIDEQIEIRNLKNKLNFLKKNRDILLNDYQDLEEKYKIILENYNKIKQDKEDVINENNKLAQENKKLNNDLNQVNNENKDLIFGNNELKVNNKELQVNLSKISHENNQLSIEIKDLRSELNDKEVYVQSTGQKNRSFEINNAELKNTISRYVAHSKKLQEKINNLEKTSLKDQDEQNKKIRFYQDENVRLSGELLLSKKNSEIIKLNLNDIEIEKNKISDKIKELNKSIQEKRNVISTNFVSENANLNKNTEYSDETKKDLENLNDKEQKSLDEVISKIFQKL